MPVKLYYALGSPPGRSALIVLKLLNIPHELQTVNVIKGEQYTDEFTKMNPQRTIPVLDDNGFIVLDSHAINAYLVSKYAKDDKLYPKDIEARSVVDHRLHFDTGVLFPLFRNLVIAYRRDRSITGMTQEIVYKFEEARDMVEAFLENHRYIAGNEPTIADISVFTSLTTLEVLWPSTEDKYPLILSYIKRCQENIPHLASINEAGLDLYKKFVIKGFNLKL